MQIATVDPLSLASRAILFLHLSAMEKAGLPTIDAFGLLSLPSSGQTRVQKMRLLLARHIDLPSAGVRSGLFTPLEAAALRAALIAGSPERTYHRLATFYTLKSRQLAQLKSRATLPIAILLAALLIRPLPSLLTGAIGSGAYLWLVLRPFVVLGVVVTVGWAGWCWLSGGRQTPLRGFLQRLQLSLPIAGSLHRRRNRCDFFEHLALLLEAGVALFDALPVAVATVPNNLMARQFNALQKPLHEGATLAEAVRQIDPDAPSQLVALIDTGEASGTLPEMLDRFVAEENAHLSQMQQEVVTWLPRLFYAMVAAWMAYAVLSSGPIQDAAMNI